jgi:hypothetical protein
MPYVGSFLPKLKGFHSSQYYQYREDCDEKRLIFTISNDASKLIQGLFELVCIESFLIMILRALQPHNDFSTSDTPKTSFLIKPNPLHARSKLVIIAPQTIHHNKHLIHSGILALQFVEKNLHVHHKVSIVMHAQKNNKTYYHCYHYSSSKQLFHQFFNLSGSF